MEVIRYAKAASSGQLNPAAIRRLIQDGKEPSLSISLCLRMLFKVL